MHAKLKLVTAFALLAIVFTTFTAGAAASSAAQTADDALLAQLQRETQGTAHVTRHTETGAVNFIGTTLGHAVPRAANLHATATAEQAARAFLATYGKLFGLRDQATDLSVLRAPAFDGRTFVRFQQRHRGVPVLGGELIVQVDALHNVVSAHGELLPDLSLDTNAVISRAAAQQQALAATAKYYERGTASLSASTPELWIFNPSLLGGPGARVARLVWRMDVRGAPTEPIRELVLIDARTGDIALNFNQIAYGKERHVCDDNNQVDADGDENNNCKPSDYVRNEGEPPVGIQDVDLAYELSGQTYDYFFSNYGRDSIDGAGMPLISLVRYCSPTSSCPYQNAFWNGQQMTYGDGFASADDVVAHELTHGVTERTSGLFYYYQSGAINESMSDVFGEYLDLTNGFGNDAAGVRWQMGEDLPSSIGVIRDMQDPSAEPYNDPDKMTSSKYSNDPLDNGGVHSNSGVNNKAAYLMVDGGSFNGYTITGLGLAKAGQIYYRTNTALLTSGSDYQDLYNALQTACQSLIGTHGISAADCAEVTKIVNATEMHKQPTIAPAPEAEICAAGTYVNDLFFDDLENPASGNWAASAVTGSTNAWYYPPSAAPEPPPPGETYATSGKLHFWGLDVSEVADYAIAMTKDVTVPANAFMHFDHAYSFEVSLLGRAYDGGVLEYSTDGGKNWQDAEALLESNGYNGTLTSSSNALNGRQAFIGLSNGYGSSRADLSTLAGKNVRFRFRIGTDISNGLLAIFAYGWFIDDIRIYTCSTTPPAQPAVAFDGAASTVSEGADQATVTVSLNKPATQAVSVKYSVTGGTATQGDDYTLMNGTLTFPKDTQVQTLIIPIKDDLVVEANETIQIALSEPVNATLGSPTSTTIMIADNDSTSTLIVKTYLPLLNR